ncbi:MAG TPA: TerD family protein [Nocardioides sp.]
MRYGGAAGEPSIGWALVDVETTGLSPQMHRVLSVACRTVEDDGRVSGEWSSLVDPGCDPGPVHIHGITRERLRGAPPFEQVAEHLHRMVRGRVLVAHNAKFDHAFLQSESRRNGHDLPVDRRLCTLTASRRLDLPVENYRLASLARYWGVRQERAHDALDDVRVLSEIFAHTRVHATRLGIGLPVLACGDDDRAAPVTPAKAPRVPCLYANPPTWSPGEPLVQGMKIVITGDTRRPRSEWYARLIERGLNPMNNVSSQTRLVLSDSRFWQSVKLQRARELAVPVLTELDLERLVEDVRPGVTHEEAAAATRQAARRARAATTAAARGPWAGRVVMVLGGTHAEASAVRAEAAGRGARVLVTLGASTTHVVVLAGAERDRRWGKVRERGLTVVGADLTEPDDAVPDRSAETEAAGAAVLVRGQVIDLPTTDRLGIDLSWDPAGPVVDVVAFLLGPGERVRSDDDFVFYNQPSTSGVALSLDGDAEQAVALELDEIDAAVERIQLAAVIDGAGTFADVGPIAVRISGDGSESATSVLDAASVETALVVAEVYRRRGVWRLRIVGRGHERSLAELASALGVDVES